MADRKFEKQSLLKKELIQAVKELLKDAKLTKSENERLSSVAAHLKSAPIPEDHYQQVLVFVFMITSGIPGIYESATSLLLKNLSKKCLVAMENHAAPGDTSNPTPEK